MTRLKNGTLRYTLPPEHRGGPGMNAPTAVRRSFSAQDAQPLLRIGRPLAAVLIIGTVAAHRSHGPFIERPLA